MPSYIPSIHSLHLKSCFSFLLLYNTCHQPSLINQVKKRVSEVGFTTSIEYPDLLNQDNWKVIKDNSINDSNINENITFLYIIYPLLISLATGIRSVKTLPIIFPHTGHSTSSRSRLPSHIDLSLYESYRHASFI